MNINLTRRHFIAATTAGLVTFNESSTQNAYATTPEFVYKKSFPSTEPETAKEIVLVSHFGLKRVQELLSDDRSLALASWDWGFGDWESALGAASHMGRRDIAETLIDHGARPNLFTLAMMDSVDAVRSICESVTGIQKIRGPHGITLLNHAKKGKASKVTAYLQQLGDADIGVTSHELSPDQCDIYVGEYGIEGGMQDRLIVRKSKSKSNVLGILKEGGSFRTMHRTGEHVFSPAGAPHVSIRFGVQNNRAKGLTIHRGRPIVSAKMID